MTLRYYEVGVKYPSLERAEDIVRRSRVDKISFSIQLEVFNCYCRIKYRVWQK